MSSPYNDILFKVEDAIVAVIDQLNITDLEVHAGGDNDKLEFPYVTVVAEVGETRQPLRGNFGVQAVIDIHTSADDASRAQRIAMVKTIGDALWTDDIAATLTNAVSDFTAMGVNHGNHSQGVSGRGHIYTMKLMIACKASD
jgi:hypothetical protein